MGKVDLSGELQSARLAVLLRSLARKRDAMDKKISEHFEAVKAANGQPLNDKRNGHATLSAWERQNNAIRRLKEEVEKTEAAIEREKSSLARVAEVSSSMPEPLTAAVGSGLLRQWRKHPRTFFVEGVDKARIVLLDDGRLAHRYASSITDPDQRRTFARTYNELSAQLRLGGA